MRDGEAAGVSLRDTDARSLSCDVGRVEQSGENRRRQEKRGAECVLSSGTRASQEARESFGRNLPSPSGRP